MTLNAKTEIHAQLMARMIDTTGADAAAMTSTREAALLAKCCSCANVGACEDWLEDHAEGANRAPSFCANSDVMQRLQV